MAADGPGRGDSTSGEDPAAGTPGRARGSRKSARAHLHPVEDPDAWRNAVLAEPEPPVLPTEHGP